jgi:hypothetical protein
MHLPHRNLEGRRGEETKKSGEVFFPTEISVL